MSKAILLADDSVTIQKVIELTFMDQDVQIEAVSSGDEALRRLAGEIPDLVIADVHMPGASGFDVARRSKELSPGTPVLLLVGTFEPFDESDFAACGADEVLKKPFDSQELLRLVERLLPAPAAAPAAAPAPIEEEDDSEDTGVFSLDDDAFGGSSEVLPPPDLLADDSRPAAGLAWDAERAQPQGPAAFGIGDLSDDEPEELDFTESEAPEESFEVASEESFEVSMEEEVEELEAAEPYVEEPFADEPYVEEPFADEPFAGDSYAEEPEAEEDEEPTVSEGPVFAADNGHAAGALSDDDVDRIARRVLELAGDRIVRDVAWEVIPDLAEVVIRQRLRELESQVE
ncbi:MAG: response regulator [Acidobacteria bacterium]|nr:response regulator [Acidobacteriota bacterium]